MILIPESYYIVWMYYIFSLFIHRIFGFSSFMNKQFFIKLNKHWTILPRNSILAYLYQRNETYVHAKNVHTDVQRRIWSEFESFLYITNASPLLCKWFANTSLVCIFILLTGYFTFFLKWDRICPYFLVLLIVLLVSKNFLCNLSS